MKDINEDHLEDHPGFYEKWVIKTWLKNDYPDKKLLEIFYRLFLSLFDDLSAKVSPERRDDLFKNFINVVFPTVLDVFKWHTSEKEQHDIGVISSLQAVASQEWYINLLSSYSRQYEPE